MNTLFCELYRIYFNQSFNEIDKTIFYVQNIKKYYYHQDILIFILNNILNSSMDIELLHFFKKILYTMEENAINKIYYLQDRYLLKKLKILDNLNDDETISNTRLIFIISLRII